MFRYASLLLSQAVLYSGPYQRTTELPAAEILFILFTRLRSERAITIYNGHIQEQLGRRDIVQSFGSELY